MASEHPSAAQRVADLIAVLQAPDASWEDRKRAADALQPFGSAIVLPLVRAWEAGTLVEHACEYAIEMLGRAGDSRAFDVLVDALLTGHPGIRQEAAKALAKVGDPRAIAPLIASFRHEFDDTEAITAWQDAAKALSDFGTAALPALAIAILDRDEHVRSLATCALGGIKDPRAVELLIGALSDSDGQVRADAADALGEIGDNHAVDGLLLLLRDGDSYVRLCAVRALGYIKDRRAVDPLTRLLQDADASVRSQTIHALSHIAHASR